MPSINGRSGVGNIPGPLVHTGSTVGLYSVTPAARPSAYTQTFATADKTHANPTGTALTSLGVSGDHTLVDVTTTAVSDPVKVNANFDDVAAVVNALIVDMADVKSLANSVIDDLQTLGILQ